MANFSNFSPTGSIMRIYVDPDPHHFIMIFPKNGREYTGIFSVNCKLQTPNGLHGGIQQKEPEPQSDEINA